MSLPTRHIGFPPPSPTDPPMANDCRPAVTLLANVVAPNRVPIYQALASSLRLTVLFGGDEGNRTIWAAPEVRGASMKRSRGWVFDPEDPVEFASKRKRAVIEGLPAPDTSRLLPIKPVAAMLVEDINPVLESHGRAAQHV